MQSIPNQNMDKVTNHYYLSLASRPLTTIISFCCLMSAFFSMLSVPAAYAVRAPSVSTSNVSSWQMSGAIAARKQNQGWNASFNWQQQGPNHYQIRLNGPLGNGAVLITRQGNTVTYRDGPKRLTGTNASTMLERQTGVRLPVNYLYYWVRGLPAPGPVQSIKRDSNNHLLFLRQAGYTIEYSQYKTIKQFHLPTRMRVHNNQVFLKLVIRQWGI